MVFATGSRLRSDAKASLVRAMPRRLALRLVDLVRHRVRVDAGIGGRARCTRGRNSAAGRGRCIERISTRMPVWTRCTVPITTPSAPSSRHRSNGTSPIDSGGRNRLVRVARNHVELALEVHVVPQHLADHPRCLLNFLVGREGDEVWHGQARRRPGLARDAHFDAGGLLRCRRRRGRLLLRGERSGRQADCQRRPEQMARQRTPCEVSRVMPMILTVCNPCRGARSAARPCNAAGSGGNCRVSASDRCEK